MRAFNFRRRAGRGVIATALAVLASAAPALATTFDTPGEHVYVVPDGITNVAVVASGGHGGGDDGGNGALVRSLLHVEPGSTIYVEVGSSAIGSAPGLNGGGATGTTTQCPRNVGAGGGASDIRTIAAGEPGSLESRLLIAGGGGGTGTTGTTSSALAGWGGNRGNLGRYAAGTGRGFGGDGGLRGVGGSGDGTRAGTADSGGTGQPATVTSRACGGGGGGGWGGGAGGHASTANTGGGGGGGGGGSLDPDRGNLGQPAPDSMTPHVTIEPAPSIFDSTLQVSTDVYILVSQTTNCPTSCNWCTGGNVHGIPAESGCLALARNTSSADAGFFSQQNWGAAATTNPRRNQSGAGTGGTAPAGLELEQPFLMADFAHFNEPIRGDSPTELGLGGRIVLQPPAGPPVTLPIGLFSPGFEHPSLNLNFLETDNGGSCDPSIQKTTTPCDDRFRLSAGVDTTPPFRVDARRNGVNWHVDVLGWADGAGGYSAQFISEERKSSYGEIYAQVSVDTTTTKTWLSDDLDTLTARIIPRPTTGGGVTFRQAGEPVPGCADVSVSTDTGKATCPVSALAAGPVTSDYSGAIGFGPNTSAPYTIGDRAPDDTAPVTRFRRTPELPSGKNGWDVIAVNTNVTATDNDGSGVAQVRCVLNPQPAPATFQDLPARPCAESIKVAADGKHTIHAAAIDNAGNEGAIQKFTFKVDHTPPVPYTSPGTLYLREPGRVAIPQASDAWSGVATKSCGSISTASAGYKKVTCTATDLAGNTRSTSNGYLVNYKIAIISPVRDAVHKYRSTYTVKASLADFNNARISDTEAKGLLSASPCRVKMSVGGDTNQVPGCMTYDSGANEFRRNWTVTNPFFKLPGGAAVFVRVTYPGTTLETEQAQFVDVVL